MHTQVELLWIEGQIERWIRFGRPASERIVDRRRRILFFEPNAIFAFVRWRSGPFGTVSSRITIARAVAPGEAFTTVPHVAPGAEILLNISGWPKVQAVLDAIAAVEATGVHAEDASPEHWRAAGGRIAVGMAPRPYDRARHRAWLLRRRLGR